MTLSLGSQRRADSASAFKPEAVSVTLTGMDDPQTKSIFDTPPDGAREAELDARAEADIAAGRVVLHAEVVEWLESWGTDKPLPCPKPELR